MPHVGMMVLGLKVADPGPELDAQGHVWHGGNAGAWVVWTRGHGAAWMPAGSCGSRHRLGQGRSEAWP